MSIGLDLGTSSVKVVEVRGLLGKVRLAGVARQRVAHLRAGEYRHSVPRMLADSMGAQLDGKNAVVGVTGRDISLQVLVFPGSKLTNYPQMLRNEIRERRGEANDMYIDHATLRRPDAYFPMYLTAIGMAKGGYIDEQMAIVKTAGMSPVDVVPTPFALAAAYLRAYAIEGGTVMLLNVGSDNTDLVMLRGGRIMFTRNISQGAKMFDEQIRSMGGRTPEEAEVFKIKYASLRAEDQGEAQEQIRPAIRQAAYQFVQVVNSTLAYARSQLAESDLGVDKLYLSGGGARLPGLDVYLRSALKTEVEWLDPFRGMDTSVAKNSGDGQILQLPTDLAVAVGLAHIGNQRARHTFVSLVPDRTRERRKFLRTVPFMVASVIALVATLAAITTTLKIQKDEVDRGVAALVKQVADQEARTTEMDKIEQSYRDLYVKHDRLFGHTTAGPALMDTYTRLRRQFRDGLVIEKLELKPAESVRRVIANVPDKGHVVGTPSGEDEDTITVKDVGAAPKSQAVQWEGQSRTMFIYGEVDENIKGGPDAALFELRDQLSSEAGGIRCSIDWISASPKRPGWRAFSMKVKFE